MLPHELQNAWNEIQLHFDEGTYDSPEAQAKIKRFVEEGPAAVDQWVSAIKMAEMEVVGYADRMAKLSNKKSSKEKAIKRMRENLRFFVETAFSGSVKLPEWTVTTPSRVQVTRELREGHHPAELPEDCYKTEYKLKDEVIKKRLAAGEDLPIDEIRETKHLLVIR